MRISDKRNDNQKSTGIQIQNPEYDNHRVSYVNVKMLENHDKEGRRSLTKDIHTSTVKTEITVATTTNINNQYPRGPSYKLQATNQPISYRLQTTNLERLLGRVIHRHLHVFDAGAATSQTANAQIGAGRQSGQERVPLHAAG